MLIRLTKDLIIGLDGLTDYSTNYQNPYSHSPRSVKSRNDEENITP